MRLHPKIPLTLRLERPKVLDAIGVKVLELEAIGPQDGADEMSCRH
jgi:hypothetical protein